MSRRGGRCREGDDNVKKGMAMSRRPGARVSRLSRPGVFVITVPYWSAGVLAVMACAGVIFCACATPVLSMVRTTCSGRPGVNSTGRRALNLMPVSIDTARPVRSASFNSAPFAWHTVPYSWCIWVEPLTAVAGAMLAGQEIASGCDGEMGSGIASAGRIPSP